MLVAKESSKRRGTSPWTGPPWSSQSYVSRDVRTPVVCILFGILRYSGSVVFRKASVGRYVTTNSSYVYA